MKIHEYDIVRLKNDMNAQELKKGDVGTVVMVYDSDSRDYEVEFCSDDGVTQSLLTLHEDMLEKM